MSRIHERRGHWVQALVISLALHGAAAAAIMDVLPSLPGRATPTAPLPEIDITSLPLEQGIAAPVTLQPTSPTTLSAVNPVAPDPAPKTGTPNVPDTPSQTVLTPSNDMLQATRPVLRPDGTLHPSQPGTPSETVVAALPPGLGTSGAAGDPITGSSAQNEALADLIGQLRDRLAEPCLASMPQTLATDEVLLTTFSANDRAISDLFRDLSGTVDLPMTERSVLLDARQCPAVDFVRAATTYPAFRLHLQIDAAEVASGDRLTGRVAGIGGNQATLLLIDDNGVVQDLRRFTLQSGDQLQFDVPVRRVGADRDTSQLLIALATPTRPEFIANLAGRLAEDFFPPLAQVNQDQALIGMAPVYVRAER